MPGHHIVFFIVIHSAVSGFVMDETIGRGAPNSVRSQTL